MIHLFGRKKKHRLFLLEDQHSVIKVQRELLGQLESLLISEEVRTIFVEGQFLHTVPNPPKYTLKESIKRGITIPIKDDEGNNWVALSEGYHEERFHGPNLTYDEFISLSCPGLFNYVGAEDPVEFEKGAQTLRALNANGQQIDNLLRKYSLSYNQYLKDPEAVSRHVCASSPKDLLTLYKLVNMSDAAVHEEEHIGAANLVGRNIALTRNIIDIMYGRKIKNAALVMGSHHYHGDADFIQRFGDKVELLLIENPQIEASRNPDYVRFVLPSE